ncbi:MAG: FISUMP domain-containing protein [Sulfurovum sp.]
MKFESKILISTILLLLSINSCGDRAAAWDRSENIVPIVIIEDKDGDGYNSDVDPDDNNPCIPSIEAGTCDRDGDTLTNIDENNTWHTDYKNPDTDGDGFDDGNETRAGTDPLNPCDPNPNAGICDRDSDGLTNAQEGIIGTDPSNPDTDGDGFIDGTGEYKASPYSDPLNPCDPTLLAGTCDRDFDGLTNNEEGVIGTDPINPDTDGDGVKDGTDKNITSGASTALLSCLPKQLPLYKDYNNSNAMWIAENCDNDSYSNGAEDNKSLAPNNYLSDPYDAKSGCFVFGTYTYCEVYPKDGRVWLDRDLGTPKVCTYYNEFSCYGSLYQWGRASDGHQHRNSTRTQDINPQTFPYSSNSQELSSTGLFDWLTANGLESTSGFIIERKASWQSLINNSVCPKNWYVPSKAELDTLAISEGITNSATAFNSAMKFVVSGSRSNASSGIEQDGLKGYVWSIDSNVTGNTSYAFTYTSSAILWSKAYRATGYSVRCIKSP